MRSLDDRHRGTTDGADLAGGGGGVSLNGVASVIAERLRDRPDWLPPGNPWLDGVAVRQIATTAGVTVDLVGCSLDYVRDAVRDPSQRIRNPAGLLRSKIDELRTEPDLGTVYRWAEAERERERQRSEREARERGAERRQARERERCDASLESELETIDQASEEEIAAAIDYVRDRATPFRREQITRKLTQLGRVAAAKSVVLRGEVAEYLRTRSRLKLTDAWEDE